MSRGIKQKLRLDFCGHSVGFPQPPTNEPQGKYSDEPELKPLQEVQEVFSARMDSCIAGGSYGVALG